MSTKLPDDIEVQIGADFVDVERARSILLTTLDQYRSQYSEPLDVRVIRCAIKLADGDIDELQKTIEQALVDPRDLMLWAEYDDKEQHVWDGSVPFALPDWRRPFFDNPGGDPFLFYVLYGAVPKDFAISGSRYRCAGIPDGVDLSGYGPDTNPEVVEQFRSGYVWDELQQSDPTLTRKIAAQTECLVIRGELADAPTLNDFRNTLGLITWLLDQGMVAVYDPLQLKWWPAAEWREQVFAPASAQPQVHVLIITSKEDKDRQWIHTRGLRKFGRPELSIRAVMESQREAAIELCQRFITFQAYGGIIEEGRAIRMKGLPQDWICHHAGDLEDLDFNNVHVEIGPTRRGG
jgi:hypothetical protein